ncbi:NifB/NifX family molybdenum-iron cluster-binding protein [Crassaminicella indica]|uniref:NifB/NifX family molybdenum-iron cluster-binding protein n=1 Tax=Crassaminicella indica TaxID=2855394 RepID=A0ABX8RC39_9CLOT|nr:NifB/NifX family molybdenum-iron cluster-binding protein [Crassaminicella indica]QXM05290.1 NifB/NifX family molybdenum-iron cluster-binding protein [Crassaminicella indica]
MKVAIAKDGNFVSGHFGHCEGFEVFEVNNGAVEGRSFLENPGHRPGFLPPFLAERGIEVIIAGGMGATAQELFKENGVKVVVGAQGKLEDVINAYASGNLKSTDSVCTEHAHEGHCND